MVLLAVFKFSYLINFFDFLKVKKVVTMTSGLDSVLVLRQPVSKSKTRIEHLGRLLFSIVLSMFTFAIVFVICLYLARFFCCFVVCCLTKLFQVHVCCQAGFLGFGFGVEFYIFTQDSKIVLILL